MSEAFDEQVIPAAEIGLGDGNKTGAENESLFDQLRARRDEIASTKTTTIPLPGFEDFGLEVQYRLMDRDEVGDIGDRVVKETKDRTERMMLLLIDTLIFALDGFMVKEKGKPDPKPLHDQNGTPVLSWSHLVQELGDNPADDRAAVRWIFGNNDLAIGQHAILLNRWMGNTSFDVEAELGNLL